MKNKAKLAGIIAIAAFIGFTLISCKNPFENGTVATPVANPPTGTYNSAQSVTLSCDTGGASIYYTTNGTDPTADSALYSASPIAISTSATLKAIAVKSGMEDSRVLTAVYTINNPQLETVATPAANPAAGTYTSAQSVTLSCDTGGASIYYTLNGTDPTAGSALYSAPIAISQTTTLKAIAVKDGMNDSDVLEAVYTINNPQLGTVATPTANPAAGTYNSAQSVTLSCATGGASIYYTTNGTNPTTSSTPYSTPITINTTTTLKAIAVKSGMNNSAVLTAAYTIDTGPTVTPVTSWKGLSVPSTTTAAKQHSSYQGKSDVLHVAPANTSNGYDWRVLSYDLAAYANQEITITVSMQVWLDVSTKVAWQVNVSDTSYPVIAGSTSTALSAGQWHTVQGNATITPGAGKSLYLSKDQLVGNPATIGTPPGNVEIYITGFTVTIDVQGENPDVLLHTKWPFKVGAAAPGSAFTTSNGQYPLLKQFNVLVAENDMKPDAVMPTSKPSNFNTSTNLVSSYRWTNADRLVNYAEANNTAIRGHVLIWHSQTPNWFFTGSGVSGRATKAELYNNMETHIKTVFQKYGGRVGWWDVCNEVVDDSGNGPRTNSPYTQIMEDSGAAGMDRYEYVLKAFQWARQYADANSGQNVKLYLTDYNTEYDDKPTDSKQDEFARLVDYLIQNDAPIDGVGFQSHIQYDWPSVNDISNAIDLFSTKQRKDGTKLMTQVCELDITLFKWSESISTLEEPELTNRLALQTTKYRALFEMFRQKYDAGKLDAVLVWGLSDAHSWLNDRQNKTRVDHPLLFDRSYQPKAAYNELVR